MSEKNIEHIRHTLAHLLAASVRELYPQAKNAIGPSIDDGFYQDFDFGDQKISDTDLPHIEHKMREKLKTWNGFERREVSLDEAKKEFSWNEYKCELIEEFGEEHKKLTFYTAGGFVDLCKGGHADNPSHDIEPNSFKLDRIAGAYWRGDEKNKMLTRIYGLAFESKEQLDEYLKRREELAARDHRKIGKEQGLWTFSDLVGSGLPIFTPKGTALRNALYECLYEISKRHSMLPVTIPHMAKRRLYEISGHADKFGDEILTVKSKYDEFVLKPVNCPHHTQIYVAEPRSYRDLPLRYMESTMQYRDEQPGELSGLTRVRAITVDDGHIFCRIDQVEEEAKNIAEIIKEFYSDLGMWGHHWVSLSVRDPQKLENYIGHDDDWKRAEEMLQKVSDSMGLDAKRMEGEAALYGPKLDFMFTDALGRERQLSTIQIDFAMPKRFGLEYADKDGSRQTPVMIHRAMLGSYERFMAILIEHFAGAYPTWLSPVQVKILPVSEKHAAYARDVYNILKAADIRAELDDSNEKLGKKVRNAKVEKVPYWLVVGDAEVDAQTATLEHRELGKIGAFPVADIVARLLEEIKNRALRPSA